MLSYPLQVNCSYFVSFPALISVACSVCQVLKSMNIASNVHVVL